MKSYLLMHKETGDLIEGIEISFIGNESVTDEIVMDRSLFAVALVSRDGWIVNHPSPAFGEFWIYMPNKIISRDWVVVGEV